MSHQILLAWSNQMTQVEDCFSKNRRNDHEERELSHVLSAVAKEKTCSNGRTRTAETWQDGCCLCQTDDESILDRDVFLLARTHIIGEGEQNGCHEKTDAYHLVVAECLFHPVLEEYAHDADRYH